MGEQRQLADLEAIRNLIASYGPLADAGEALGVAALWEEDGEYDVGGFGIAKGRAEIAALIESDTHRQLMADGCAHVLSPHHIVVSGESANAKGYSVVYRKERGEIAVWRVARNEWLLRRQPDGSWLVTRRVNRPI